ncbi:cytochrome P450 [Mycolicibacterium mageritense]|uniref:cytochrome P450 n=1 Tax=Mycolicibacterium mageritense TaxID=53462 RepID=UPI0011D4F29E|nr:cytochrome P450 [Mycolicibacterium mageritense]TXI57432.1 MAG: cytochrome P450 [Mycolicibacterium mageritense]
MDIPRVRGLEAVATLSDLGFASVSAGVIARRRPMARLLERVQADARAVKRIQRLRKEFGRGPVELVLPGRRIAVVIDPEDVGAVLTNSPRPFDPANREKRKALQWFQPHGVLISQGAIRSQRRAVNDAALDSGAQLHRLADSFVTAIIAEAETMAAEAMWRGQLDSAQFMTGWWRLVRRLVLGERARDDEAITDHLLRLRKAGNWSFLALPHYRARGRFTEQLYRYAEAPEAGSLVSALAETPAAGAVDPVGQIPQWLFAFDAAGMALLRALAVLSTHPAHLERAMSDATDPDRCMPRPYLRGCVLESVRLWPTTPTILRDTTEDTVWRSGGERFTLAKGSAVMIVAPAFHRDDELLPFAHEFVPDIWLDGRAERHPQLVPFSAGPAECPGRNLVLFTTSTLAANLLRRLRFDLQSTPRPLPGHPLPMTFNQFGLDFCVRPVEPALAVGPATS